MADNPLAARKPMQAKDHPGTAHAVMWKMVQGIPREDLANKIEQVDAALPVLGKLAGDPNVTRKDVIKAAADAAGSGKVPPDQAVSIISQMPDDPTKLQAWLRDRYAAAMSAAAHMKAAAMSSREGTQ